MIETIGFTAPGGAEWFVVFILFMVSVVLPIVLIVWAVKAIIRNRKENQRLRLEVGKLADELEQTRKQTTENQ